MHIDGIAILKTNISLQLTLIQIVDMLKVKYESTYVYLTIKSQTADFYLIPQREVMNERMTLG